MFANYPTRLARLLVDYCVAVQPGERVTVNVEPGALDMLPEVFRAIVRAGGHPHVAWTDTTLAEILFKEGSEEQIAYISPFHKVAVEEFECSISLNAPANSRTLADVDPAVLQKRQMARQPLMETYMRRTGSGDYRWVVTAFPSNAAAQEAGMSLADYAAFLFGAMRLDADDPVASWQAMSRRQALLVDWLADKKVMTVTGPHVDLTFSINGRTWINDDGHFNMPGGEIFTAPVEDSVNGRVRFTYPAVYRGREVENVELTFADGRVVDATAGRNESFLHSVLDTDEGARCLGEFAIGTNDGIRQFTRSTLFDEKIGGTIHMAVGTAYPQSGGVNQSAIHWDMVCDMRTGGRITVDGQPFYDSGRFLLDGV